VARAGTVDISVVVPVYNEVESIPELVAQVEAVLDPLGSSYELILVDDGSTDDSWAELSRLRSAHPRMVAIRLAANRGQTPALMAGFDASRGRVVVTLDGDLQNDPADIPRLLEELDRGYEIVSGWRKKRQDGLLLRRVPSIVANWISRRVTGLTIHDNGCALKAYRGEVLRSVSLYSEFHRFIVPLAQMGGARVSEVETNHRARVYGHSKYGLGRVLRVLADLTTLLMVTRYSHQLVVWFLLFAIPIFGLAVVFAIWVGHILVGNASGPLVVPVAGTVLLFHSALAAAGYGLFAERIRFLAPTRQRTRSRIVATVTGVTGEGIVLLHGSESRRVWRYGSRSRLRAPRRSADGAAS
jgi:glycosyltransferase involved in cell wall biosynthesis